LNQTSIGTDRTGVFSILLEKLLGVKEEDVIRDYLFSNFGAIGSKRELTKYKLITASLAKYPGKTEAERTQNYLLAIGVNRKRSTVSERLCSDADASGLSAYCVKDFGKQLLFPRKDAGHVVDVLAQGHVGKFSFVLGLV